MKKKKAREAPQRLYRVVDVCDRCGGENTFRVTACRRGVWYLRCATCGRRATRIVMKDKRAGA